jgi:sec-independent protein translocase protein TatB
MFDVGFSELLMLGLVSLLVIGPERLPKAARFAGFWLGRTRAMLNAVKAEFEQEIHAEEIRQLLKEQSGMDQMRMFSNELSEMKQAINPELIDDNLYQKSLVKESKPQAVATSEINDTNPESVASLSTEQKLVKPTDGQ